MSIELIQRDAVIKEALAWQGTPYHHQGRVKGAGVDCATLLCEVYEKAGVIPFVDPRPYPPDWHLHRNDEVYLGWLKKFAKEINNPKPGDVMVWKFGRCFSHGAIMINHDYVIHAYLRTPVSLANFKAEPLVSRPVKYFTLWA